MPFFLFAVRLLIRNVLVLAHNVLVIAVVFVVFRVWPGWYALLAIPGLLLWGSMRSRWSCCWGRSARGSATSCRSWPA